MTSPYAAPAAPAQGQNALPTITTGVPAPGAAFKAINGQDEQGALDNITKMLQGTHQLVDQPGLVYALQQQQAKPQDAQAIDQFLQGLDAEKQVRLAQATGAKIPLSDTQKLLLGQLGVDYSGSEYTQTDAANDGAKQITLQSQGQYQARRDAQGNIVVDASGNIQTEQTPVSHYKAKGIGRLFHTLNNDIVKPAERDVLSPTVTVLSKGYNWSNTNISEAIHHPGDIFTNHMSDEMRQDMSLQGYDPNNVWSQQAYAASGKAKVDFSNLRTQWDSENPSGLFGLNGTQAVAEADKFLNDPKSYRTAIETDKSLSPAQVALKLQMLSSPQFSELATRLNAKTASVGNDVSNAIGIDPVKHPTAYALTTAGTNLAVAFVIDPTIMLGKAAKAAKMSQVGIDSLGDAAGAAAKLDPALNPENASFFQKAKFAVTQPFLSNVQRGWQTGIDLTHQISAATEAGDAVKAAALTARMNAELPALVPLMADIAGKNRILEYADKIVDGKKISEPVFGEGEGIHNLADAATYVSSKYALTRLMNGRAATQATLMPGALSAVGYRKVKGAVAEWMTARSGERAENAYTKVTSAAATDPGLAQKLITEGDLVRIQPQADDAVNALSDQVLATQQRADAAMEAANAASGTKDAFVLSNVAQASKVEAAQAQAGLASAQRAAVANSTEFALTAQGRGNVAYNLRRSGTALGDGSVVGWASPTAVAARARLAAQRWSTLLPRNTVININDSSSADKIRKYALTYLNRGDANALMAAWNVGDMGMRKNIVSGLVDQVGHAAGLSRTTAGQKLLDTAKTKVENYSSVGDNVTVDGQVQALHAGQTIPEWTLPSFRAIQQASSKIGLWEGTMGRALTSDFADKLMSQWKIIKLLKPSTITRNQLEGWGRTALEGKWGDAVKARAVSTMPNRELWAKGLADESKAEYEAALDSGDTKLANSIARGNMLDGPLMGRSTPIQAIAQFAPVALASRAYRTMLGKTMSEEHVAAIAALGPTKLREWLEGYGQQHLAADLGDREAARQVSEITRFGYGPAKLRYRVNDAMRKMDAQGGQIAKWTDADTAGTVGADRYANALAQRVNATPSVTNAVMDLLEKPNQFDISHVVSALDDPAVKNEMSRTGYGSVYWEDTTASALRATTPEQVQIGKEEWARKVVNDYTYLLKGQNGVYQQALAKEIRTTGKAPDADWISTNLAGHNRPNSVLAPEMLAMPVGGERGFIQALQDVQGAGYQWLVERPLQRTTTSPVFLANYADARVGLNPMVEKLVAESGVSREGAEAMAEDMAGRNAWVKTEQLVDDPGQKSQLDIIGRNFFSFSRAAQAMIRRWGTGLWQDPARARKMMLALEGSQQSGLVYRNQYGELTFTYPGSGVMDMMMRQVAKIPGFEGIAQFPIASTMTGGVQLAVPGADDPFRMSMSPMITVPMRQIFNLFPDHRSMLDEVDRAINGPVGQGQGALAAVTPTAFSKFFAAMSQDDRNSALASSTVGAIANLAAGGQVPPADASPAVRDAFLQNVKTQVRSQLFLRAVFGLFAPAPASQPSEMTAASGADYAFHVSGIKSLSDEYKTILNDTNGDSARTNAIWSALHPDKTVYEVAQSQANASKVYLPATKAALDWMTSNSGFVSKYKTVAAYFLPAASGGEPFSDAAYKTQVELGLRQKKTPTEFYTDIRVRNAESTYYPTVKQFDAAIASARQAGQQDRVTQLTQQKSDWENGFKNQNPLFQQKIDSYSDARAKALGQLGDLKEMVKSGSVPDGQGAEVSNLISAYDGLVAYQQHHKGSDAVSVQQRSDALKMFNNWATQHFSNSPLTDLYNGVFRVLDTNFVNLTPTAVNK